MNRPLVSVLMPAFQAAAHLPRAAGSVRAQTLGGWELLIVDDGSTDTTAACARALCARDGRVRLLRHGHRRGAAAARNTALAAARGRYIAFLDADDAWHPEKLARQIAFMQATGAAFSYTGFARVSPRGVVRQVAVPAHVSRAGLLRGNVIGCLTAIYDTAQLGKVAMPDLPRRHDFALWLDLLTRTPRALGLQEVLATHWRRPGSLSSARWQATAATWHVYRAHARLGRARALGCLIAHHANRLAALGPAQQGPDRGVPRWAPPDRAWR